MAGYFMELEVIDNTRVFILPMFIEFPVSEKAIEKRIIKENEKRASKVLKKGQKRQPPLTKMEPIDRYYLNLNKYRVWHPNVEQKIKKAFAPLKVPTYFKAKKIRVSYHFQRYGNVSFDEGNVFSVVDKYFCDWLKTAGYIPDDSLRNVSHGAPLSTNRDIKTQCIATVEILEEFKEVNDPTQGILF